MSRPGRPARRRAPTPTCGCTCSRTAWSSPHGRTSTACSACCPTWCGPARARAPSRASSRPGCGCAPRGGPVTVLRRRQVPADGRLRAAGRRADRRRRPGPPRRAPRGRHHRDARGLRQLQRRHARHVDGRGPRSRPGVVVGDGSDVGGGASIMGTLSGGGKRASSSVGERCLLGANAGIGISLGDDCVVEAGLYVTAGTKVAARRRRATRRAWSRPASCPGAAACCSAATRCTGARRGAGPRGHLGRRRAERRPARQLTWRAPDAARARRRHDVPRPGAVGASRCSSSACWSPSGAAVGQALFANRYVPPLRESCVASVDGTGCELDPDQARQRRPHRRDRGAARAAGPGRDDRDRHRDPGVQAAQHRLRRPRLARPVPAAPVAGLGHRGSRCTDPVYATNAFYDALVKVDGYETMEITEAAQAVQRSAFPEAYADHEPEGRAFASALTGYSPAALTCRLRGADAGGRPRRRAPREVRAAPRRPSSAGSPGPAPTTRPTIAAPRRGRRGRPAPGLGRRALGRGRAPTSTTSCGCTWAPGLGPHRRRRRLDRGPRRRPGRRSASPWPPPPRADVRLVH